jgi:Na+/proline symporter
MMTGHPLRLGLWVVALAGFVTTFGWVFKGLSRPEDASNVVGPWVLLAAAIFLACVTGESLLFARRHRHSAEKSFRATSSP